MHGEQIRTSSRQAASIGMGAGCSESLRMTGAYHVDCYGPDGVLKWSDDIHNIVTTAGKNDLLDKYLAGSAYTAAWYVGLISATGYTSAPVAADTAASHATWAEDSNYSAATRPAAAWSAATAGSKSLSAAIAFSINATTTIKGCMLISSSVKGGTGGILYSAGLFSGGDKSVASGDTLNVSYTAAA